MTLFRPTGLAELGLMFDADMRGFPPRLPEQPIFYPVLNRDYAIQIARDWNSPSEQSGFAGFVTEFSLEPTYISQFPIQTVGASTHQELWIPAEQLCEFNRHINAPIRIRDAFFGENFKGLVPAQFALRGKNAVEQFVCLVGMFGYNGMDFSCETTANRKAIYLHFPFWMRHDFTMHGITQAQRDEVLQEMRQLWEKRFPEVPLFSLERDKN